MWAYVMIAAAVSLFAFFVTIDNGEDARIVDVARARSLAESMAAYRAAVVALTRAQPGFEGPVGEDALKLPAWWRSRPELRATVQGRIVAVYAGPPIEQTGVLQEMLKLAAGSVLVGTANRASGTLQSPVMGETGIAVPSDVPDGALVWLAARG